MTLRVDLEGFKPPIWRRLVVPSTFTFADLHGTLQIAFGWEGAHLHRFEIGREQVGPTDAFELAGYEDMLEETKLRLVDALWRIDEAKSAFRYVYDLGDDWRHGIRIEETHEAPLDRSLPACTGGRRAAPEEDSRGLDEQRMFAGDPEAFDAEQTDARLEPIRTWWSAEGEADRRGRLPLFPASSEIVWVAEDPEACLGCDGELAAADVPLGLSTGDGTELEVEFEAWPCTGCGLIHAWVSHVRKRLDEAGLDVAAVERVSLEGKRLEVREDGVEAPVARSLSGPATADPTDGLPAEELWRLHEAGRSFEASDAWPAGAIEGLVSVEVEGAGVFHIARLGFEGARPGLFVTRDRKQAEATHATINPDAGGTGAPPTSPSAFEGPIVAVGPSSLDLLARGSADRLIEAGLAEDPGDELWLPLRVDTPAPELAEEDHAVYRTILRGLEIGLEEARREGTATVHVDGVQVEIHLSALDEGDRP